MGCFGGGGVKRAIYREGVNNRKYVRKWYK